jgi:hypothetical protein
MGLTALPLIAQDDSSTGGNNQNNDRKGPPPSRLVITLDADHDKVISAAEIANATAALEPLDKNGDGELTKEEFARPKPRKDKQENAREDDQKPSSQRPPPPDPLVKALDADHDKVIDAAELADAPAALATLDKNTDGQLTREEFAPKPRRKPHGSSKSENADRQDDQAGGCPNGGGGDEEQSDDQQGQGGSGQQQRPPR